MNRFRAIFYDGENLSDVNFLSSEENPTKAFQNYLNNKGDVYKELDLTKMQLICFKIEGESEIRIKDTFHESVMKHPILFKNPIVVLDIETTGLNEEDQIIEFYACKLDKSGTKIDELEFRCKPTVEIGEGAEKKHGLTSEILKNEKGFECYTDQIIKFIDGCDLAGHNFINFDLPFIMKEFKRVGKQLILEKKYYYDTYQNWRNNTSNNLSNIYYRTFGHSFKDAHMAKGDVEATIDLLKYQHRELGKDSYTKLFDPSGQFCIYAPYDTEKNIQMEETVCIARGKEVKANGGKPIPVAQFYKINRGYINWIAEGKHDMYDVTREFARKILEKYDKLHKVV